MGCIFKRILWWPDSIFSFKMLIHFIFFPPLSFALQSKFQKKKKKKGFHFQKAYVDSHVTLRATLLVILKFFIRTCPHTAVHSLWLPHAAKGDLTSSCPAWRPVYVCFHLPVESCFFASGRRNKCKPEVLFQRSKWFMPAMSLAEWVSQPSDSVGLC